uniref:SFRICE_019768 n=1 Tax=Spodoptera frugiperda TaxID=7108 RepID=A0A2H1WRQ4_SPOFR
MMLLIISTSGENCEDIKCSHIFDEVCGMAELRDEINQVDDELCGIKKTYDPFHETRRIADHTISGANQPCNHSCPFSCTDVFRPICAMIWHVGSDSKSLVKPMINHCHVDMFSCASGLNCTGSAVAGILTACRATGSGFDSRTEQLDVTLAPLHTCYKNPRILVFMQEIATVKSLNLIGRDPVSGKGLVASARRSNSMPVSKHKNVKTSLKKHLQEVVRRIFDKYRNDYDDY